MPIDEQKIILNLKNNLEHKLITAEDLPGINRIGLLPDDTLHFEYDPIKVYGKRPDMIDNTIGMPTKGLDKTWNTIGAGLSALMATPIVAEIGGGLAATEMGPVILANMGRFGWKVLNHPITQTIGTIDGFRNLLSGNGVQKTYNHFKNGEWGRGSLSLAGDVLDASPLLGVFKAIKSGNEARKIFGNGVGLNYTLNEMPILNLFNRDNRIGFELSKIPFQEPIYRTGGESYAIITPESWWSKNRRYIPSIPEKSIPFDWNARNRVFNQTGLGLGKNSPGALHASDPESVYRITGEDQITDLLSSGYVRPKQSGKVKGGRTNEVHWSAGDDNLYYYDGRPVIEVKTSNISENSPVTSEDIKALYRKVNGEYIDVWPNIKPKIIQGFNLGGKL